MAEYDLVIHSGTVVTAADSMQADVGIRDGRIVCLGVGLRDRQEIDAHGRLVLPGGIHSHVHVDQWGALGIEPADDFLSGTRAVAFGGNTTVIPFALQRHGESLRSAVDAYHERAAGRCLVDYGSHTIVSDPHEQELPALVQDGYTSVMFMTYEGLRLKDRQLLEIFDVVRRQGALAMVRAENDDAIGLMTDGLELEGRISPYYHAVSRPPLVEGEATNRAIAPAELVDVPIPDHARVVARGGRADPPRESPGRRVLAEISPQYLVPTAKKLDLEGFGGSSSAARRPATRRPACWQGIETGLFDVFSSDHAPFQYESPKGKRAKGDSVPFRYVPNGSPGIETRLPILFSAHVAKGSIGLQRFVALTTNNHARLYGLRPRKGTIAVRSHADIAIWNPGVRAPSAGPSSTTGSDCTPYEGLEVTGWPETVIVCGEVMVQDGELAAAPGHGRFLRRDLPPWARP